jgi:hypothetical protein
VACRAVAWNELWIKGGGPAFALNELRRGSLRFTLRSKRRLVEAAGVEPAPTSNIINYFNILILYRTTGEQLFLFFNQFHHKGNNKIIVILKGVTR